MNKLKDPITTDAASRLKELIGTGVSSVADPITTRVTAFRAERHRDVLLRELGQMTLTAANAGIAADSAEIEELVAEINATSNTEAEAGAR